MKPRIRIFRGAWHCYLNGSFHEACGMGGTPLEAWLDWTVRQIQAWRRTAA